MIGVFDSGIGGLTVVKELRRFVPSQSILYFGDTARVPWGNKSPEIVRRYCDEICEFLISNNISEIVIACNTASAVATDHLKDKFRGVEIHNIIDPCVEVVNEKQFEKIGIIGTRGTISSGVYEEKIKKLNKGQKVFSTECPLFVPLAEEGWESEDISLRIAKKYLSPLKETNIDALILGCTHYPLLESVIRRAIGDGVEIISSAVEIAKKMSVHGKTEKNTSQDRFCFSDVDEHSKKIANRIFHGKLFMEEVILHK
ncbi:MAG: glutamate racemase [Patescibacteria group bacterium]|nr:glutamate racemase [Patescibacteria group bacterium]